MANWEAKKDWRRLESFVKGLVSEQISSTLYSCRKGIEKEFNLYKRGNFVVDNSFDLGRLVGGCFDALIFSAGLAEIACNLRGEEGPPFGETAVYILGAKLLSNSLSFVIKRYLLKEKKTKQYYLFY